MDTLLLGLLATAFMDLWAWVQKQLFQVPSLDYRLVGRWLLHMPTHGVSHHNILQAEPRRGELGLGWSAHYLIGIILGWIFICLEGESWLQSPDFPSALLFGLVTTVFPFFIMQPAFGFGLCASRSPRPWIARRNSLIAHSAFGVGLYLSAWLLRALAPSA